ncbi:EAL domain-containing protein [Cellulomonas sp. ATA003]|uniref:EAL domain-containing protein n=1 Tax=Cellulomonas sp. ATA003 TaxID=3073064 RepID=UPI002872D143|nr:EAL domain-containing protein [Cellulomonas sp. ATA003]WNB87161.1 EAL domain-containing protein [Cellulomonas sp. ATA003]
MPTARSAPDAALPSHLDRDRALAEVLDDATQPRLVFQPIVDLRRGVVAGYEALARFDHPAGVTPDRWFAAADRAGVGARLEARVLRAAIAVLPDVPADCFLTVNVSPHLLCEPELHDVLTSAADLRRLVLELTEHVRVDEYEPLTALLDLARGKGAVVALDDAGTGYSGLQQVALIRPEMVKIDRALVDHADRDEIKLAVTELLGAFAGRLDAVLIVEGVERPEELEAFVRLGIPLAQGWLFGRPGPGWASLPPEMAATIRDLARRSERAHTVAGLVERTATISDEDLLSSTQPFAAPRHDLVVVVDRHDRAVCLVRRGPADGSPAAGDAPPDVVAVSLRATDTAELTDVATRAMTRPPATRFDPIVCGDAYGRYLGILRPERLVLRLAELAAGAVRTDADLAPARPPITRAGPTTQEETA